MSSQSIKLSEALSLMVSRIFEDNILASKAVTLSTLHGERGVNRKILEGHMILNTCGETLNSMMHARKRVGRIFAVSLLLPTLQNDGCNFTMHDDNKFS